MLLDLQSGRDAARRRAASQAAGAAARRRRRGARVLSRQRRRDRRLARAPGRRRASPSRRTSNGRAAAARSISAIPPATAWSSPSRASGGSDDCDRLKRGDRLVVASHNPGKVWEINQLIAPYGLDAVSAGAFGLKEPEETETTFAGNARLKALLRRKGRGLAGACRRFRAGGRGARRRAGCLLGALGRARTGISASPCSGSTMSWRRAGHGPEPRRAPISSPCCVSPGPTARPRCSRARFTVIWSGRRAGPTVSAMIRCSSPTERR